MLCFIAGGGGMVVWHAPVNTVYAMSSDEVAPGVWHVYGEKDLRDDLKLVDQRTCPQCRDYVKSLINTCIREGRTLEVKQDLWNWYYSIV